MPETYLGDLFKTIPITSFMSGIASVGLDFGPGIIPLISVLEVAQRPAREPSGRTGAACGSR